MQRCDYIERDTEDVRSDRRGRAGVIHPATITRQVDIRSLTVVVMLGDIPMIRVLLYGAYLIALIAKQHGERMQALHRQAENQQQ